MARDPRLALLPETLRRIAEVTDLNTALLLAARAGGTMVPVPAEPGPDSRLAQYVGLEAARAIVQVFGAGRLLIPMAAQRGRQASERQIRAQVTRRLQEGASANTIAAEQGVHVRTVFRLRQRLDDGTLPLFDFLPDLSKK